MKTILVMGLLILSSNAFSSVVTSYDQSKSCNLYRIVNDRTQPKQIGEKIFTTKEVYGLTLEDLEINFDNREALVQVVVSIVMGFNRNVISEKSAVEETSPQFNMIINYANRKLTFLEKVCISSQNKIIYVKLMEKNK